MKKWQVVAVASACSLSLVGLTGCTPGNNTQGATLAGAAAGGIIGGSLFHGSGSWMGAAAGAVVGSVIGNQVGQYMDRQDQLNMQRAITTVPVGQQATWTNDKQVTYKVQPVKQYHKQGRYCREYKTSVKIDGQWKRAYGKACRQPDGSWKIVS